ncbi:MAG TPA: exopolysaccharide biosynthesis protein [Allosphingosinicella sp.]|nr:exopolysaccharide biosynthesis protein [Allosphingosinicella sp.]
MLERAAEAYDFGAAMRARPAAPAEAAPAAAPEAEPAPAPARAAEPARVGAKRAPAPVSRHGVAAIDRTKLAEAGFVVPDAPVTGLAEEFRLIKRQLLASIERRMSLPEDKRRSVLISSAQSGEGKSFCAINMALSLAGERDVEVLLVDADFSKPDVLSTLGIEGGPGLVDALADPSSDPEAFVIRTDVPGLAILPAGAKANNVPELLASGRTRDVLARLVAADPRRIILFDSPPALMASPASVLAGHVGQVLVIVRADKTTEADLRETMGLLSGCDQVGLILNAAGIGVTGRKFGSYDGYGHEE